MNKSAINILSALPLTGHPRDSKRITMLQESGFQIEAVAFKRKYHSGRPPTCHVIYLGTIDHGHYLRRILKMLSAIPKIRKAIKRNDLIYASGADMAFISYLAGFALGRPIIVEIGDIREVQVIPGFKGNLLRWLDKQLVDRCQLLVATTPAFVETYYRKWLKSKIPALVIENKLEDSLFQDSYLGQSHVPVRTQPLFDRPIRIGYFGLLRDEWSWKVLKSLALRKIEIILAGFPMIPVDFNEETRIHPNIHYRGEYKSPHDLPSLYNSVDLVWACYPPIGPGDMNLRWARTNRFYESCFFHKPIISREGCQDAIDVARYQIGITIRDEDVERVADSITQISLNDLSTWQQNMMRLPKSIYLYTREKDDLKNYIKNILKISDEGD